MEQDLEFLISIVKSVVSHPEDVKAERTVDERGVLITLDVNSEDMGSVIGRSGQTARAIRTLLRVVGAKNNARVNLKINVPEGGRHSTRPMDSVDTSPVDTSAVDNLDIDDIK